MTKAFAAVESRDSRLSITSPESRMRWLVVPLCWLALAAPASARPPGRLSAKPIRLRIEGYVGAKPADLVSEADWRVRCNGNVYEFHVAHLSVLVGDVGPMDIVAEVRPYPTAFTLHGTPEHLGVFTNAKAGQRLVLTGTTRSGSRRLALSQAEVIPEPHTRKPAKSD